MSGWKETLAERAFAFSALISATATLLILGFMVVMAFPLLKSGGVISLLTQPWVPRQGIFGIYPMLVTTVGISCLSLLFAFPLSLGCACLIHLTGRRSSNVFFRRMVQLMTGIPTVIYGFVGIFLLVPLVREFFQTGSGMCLLTGAMMLGILISPTMILFFCDGFDRVPGAYLLAADSVGADPAQKLLYVVLPSAKKGILVGVILAFGRAAGDTLISLMIAGNAAQVPGSLLDSVRTLTAHIALVIAADYESPEFRSIFACGLVLYLFITVIIVAVRHLTLGEKETAA
jgi:phosphate transport system permease protein